MSYPIFIAMDNLFRDKNLNSCFFLKNISLEEYLSVQIENYF